MLNYLLIYIEEYKIEYLKEQFTEEIINLLEIQKDSVITKIEEKIKINPELDIYLDISENIDEYV